MFHLRRNLSRCKHPVGSQCFPYPTLTSYNFPFWSKQRVQIFRSIREEHKAILYCIRSLGEESLDVKRSQCKIIAAIPLLRVILPLSIF